jgi:hypothetical protein
LLLRRLVPVLLLLVHTAVVHTVAVWAWISR